MALNSLTTLSDVYIPYPVIVFSEVELKLHALTAQKKLTKERMDALKHVKEYDTTRGKADIRVNSYLKY